MSIFYSYISNDPALAVVVSDMRIAESRVKKGKVLCTYTKDNSFRKMHAYRGSICGVFGSRSLDHWLNQVPEKALFPECVARYFEGIDARFEDFSMDLPFPANYFFTGFNPHSLEYECYSIEISPEELIKRRIHSRSPYGKLLIPTTRGSKLLEKKFYNAVKEDVIIKTVKDAQKDPQRLCSAIISLLGDTIQKIAKSLEGTRKGLSINGTVDYAYMGAHTGHKIIFKDHESKQSVKSA